MYSLYVNIKEWEKLPKEYQAAIEAAAYEANTDMMAKYDFKNLAALQRLVKNGVKLHAFSDEIMRAALKASYELYEDEAGKNPAWKKLYEPWKKFRDEQISWFAVTENRFDNFMIATERGLGVNQPSREYLFTVIASPVAGYFSGGARPVSVWLSQDLTRAAANVSPVGTVGEPPHRAACALAERLGTQPVMFPGDHGGFGAQPDAFAAKLHEVLSR